MGYPFVFKFIFATIKPKLGDITTLKTMKTDLLKKLNALDLSDHFNEKNTPYLTKNLKKITHETFNYLVKSKKVTDWQKINLLQSISAYNMNWFALCATHLKLIFESSKNISSEKWHIEKLRDEANKFALEDIAKFLP